jgi:hypothetical protein
MDAPPAIMKVPEFRIALGFTRGQHLRYDLRFPAIEANTAVIPAAIKITGSYRTLMS